MTTKDLIFSADPTVVDTIFYGQISGTAKHKRQVMEKLHRFLERVRNMVPEPTGLLGLEVKGHLGYEMTVFSNDEINSKYDPSSPVLSVENVYALPTAEAKTFCKEIPFFSRYMISDLPWEQVLGIELEPENIAMCGMEYAACDVLLSMTCFGFSPEEHIQRLKRPGSPYGYSQAYFGNPSESGYHIPLFTHVAEYKEIHKYMQRRIGE